MEEKDIIKKEALRKLNEYVKGELKYLVDNNLSINSFSLENMFDKYLKDKEVSKYLDVLVDGQYVDELHDPTLKWRGSSNQRVIDVPKSLATGDIITFDK
jgi:anaerobic ribonucleoside-triphosphate reductase activating protein